ncbi:MAG: TRAP transporter substrate-binding protein DctP [Pseudomonadota bacterium]|nr:TRAP transporter substrate-binding protein DctP [Pseudomonadota bacterium]
MSVSRRNLLKASLGATAGVAFLGSTGSLLSRPASAATTLTGVYYIPPSYKAISYAPDGFVQRLQDFEGADIAVDYYPSGQLLKADEQLPALRSRSIDFMFHTTSYVTRSLPILGITGLPGIVGELYDHPERLAKGSPLFNLINDELAKENLYMLSAGGGVLEPEYIWSTEASPVRSLEDLRGKKVRVVSFEATKALEKYNVAAVRIPSSETYLALQRGTVDAGVFNISTVVGRSLQEQLAYCYKLPTTGYTVAPFMLRDRWDSLDSDIKTAFEQAADWYSDNFAPYANGDVYPNEYWPKVKQEGVEVIEASAADLDAFNDAIQSVWNHWKEQVGEDVGQRAIDLALGKA